MAFGLFERKKDGEEPEIVREPEGAPALAYASWREGGKRHRLGLPEGRHMIGTSPFCAVRVDGSGRDICAVIEVGARGATLRCVGATPTLFVEGKKLAVGETTLVGDVLVLTVGRTPVQLALASTSQAAAHNRAPDSDAVKTPDDPDELLRHLSRQLLDQLNLNKIDLRDIESAETREGARLKLRKLIAGLSPAPAFPGGAEELEQRVFDEVMGLGPLEGLLSDARVTEIMVNRRDQIFVERGGKLDLSTISFSSDQALLNVIERIVSTVGRRIDASSPIVDARLLDGSRVNAVVPPLALKGPCLTIRRFSKTPISASKLVEWGSMTSGMASFLEHAVLERKNLMISGGTGSGKTTLLNALSSFIPDGERIVTVEDAAELQLQQSHVISLETRPANLEGAGAVTIRDLVKNTLRMRPDRIIVGECRGGEALDMLQAMNTGHDGSMTTAHANSPEDMLRRLETMVLMAGMELPLRAIREQIASALTLVVQQTRRKTGKRFVTEIAWIHGLERDTGEYRVVSLFKRKRDETVEVLWDELARFWEAEELTSTPKKVVQ